MPTELGSPGIMQAAGEGQWVLEVGVWGYVLRSRGSKSNVAANQHAYAVAGVHMSYSLILVSPLINYP